MTVASNARRTDVDGLRVVATYMLFPFHTAMIFSPAPFYHVRNAEVSDVMLVLSGFISLWHMPLFFLLAGWAIVASLRQRGERGFVRERLLRLGVPLVFGCIFMMPIIKYLELASGLDLNHRGLFVSPAVQESFRRVIPNGLPEMAPFRESFLEFLPTFYTQLDRFTWAHLWFVAYLLTFTLVYRPLVRWLLARRDLTTLHSTWVYAPIVPLVAVQLGLRPHWPGIQNLYDDWANVAYYSVYLLGGVLLARHAVLDHAVQVERRRALATALAAMIVLLLGVLGVVQSPSVMLAGSAVAGWCFVVAVVAYARRLPLRDGPVLEYLAESALPVYVLHQIVLVVIGYWVVRLPLGIGAKFALILGLAVVITLAVYHWLVRPLPAMRVALGMRRRVNPVPSSAEVRTAAVSLLALVVCAKAEALAAESPVGRWYAEGGAAQVEIAPCAAALCGRVVWLRSPYDENGCEMRDRWNPDPAMRGRAVVGLEILRDLTPSSGDDSGSWSGGRIYDPASGRTYRASVEADGDRLHLRGYIGVSWLGRTTTWLRVGAEEGLCRALESAEGAP